MSSKRQAGTATVNGVYLLKEKSDGGSSCSYGLLSTSSAAPRVFTAKKQFPSRTTASTVSKIAPNSLRCKSHSQHHQIAEDEDVHKIWLLQISPSHNKARPPCDFHINKKEGTT